MYVDEMRKLEDWNNMKLTPECEKKTFVLRQNL